MFTSGQSVSRSIEVKFNVHPAASKWLRKSFVSLWTPKFQDPRQYKKQVLQRIVLSKVSPSISAPDRQGSVVWVFISTDTPNLARQLNFGQLTQRPTTCGLPLFCNSPSPFSPSVFLCLLPSCRRTRLFPGRLDHYAFQHEFAPWRICIFVFVPLSTTQQLCRFRRSACHMNIFDNSH